MLASCAEIAFSGGFILDPDAALTHQEILSRFKRVFNRDMTPEEKRSFFLPESRAYPASEGQTKDATTERLS
jgi:hypothetical protein